MRLCLLVLAAFVASGCYTVRVDEQTMIPAERAQAPRSYASAAAAQAFPDAEFEEQRITAADGTPLYGALLRQPGATRTVLYFGGNGFTVERFGAQAAAALLPLGVNVLLVDHRGYGWSEGEPTTALLLGDALAVFDHASAIPGVGALVVHGQSLGGFLAAHVGANRDAAAVVLESTATTPQEWAENNVRGVYKLFVRVRVDESLQVADNRAAVARIEEPLLVIVGDEDGTTPPDLSRELYAASPLPAGRKALVVVAGAGHTSVKQSPAFAGPYTDFLDRVREGTR